MDLAQARAVAAEAVADAGNRLRRSWGGNQVVEHKGAIDLVTAADREVEEAIVGRLLGAFPDHVVVAEERSAGRELLRPPRGRWAWYVDPLDGTTNFAHGHPHFCVSLALVRDGIPVLAIVHDPLRRETFTAERGRGATLNGAPLSVSAVSELDRALLATGFPYDRREHVDFYLGFMRDFIRAAQGVRRAGSAALDLCYVAAGRLDGFWEWKLHPWDTMAGALVVEEAGGRVTDFSGGPFDAHGDQVLASNGRIHRAMIAVLEARLKAPVPGGAPASGR